jgi:hypothetical protein
MQRDLRVRQFDQTQHHLAVGIIFEYIIRPKYDRYKVLNLSEEYYFAETLAGLG